MSKSQNDGRVLKFFRVENQNPRALTTRQIEGFNKDGYVKPLDVFTPPEADANRCYFDELLRQTHEQGCESYSINAYQKTDAAIWDLTMHPRILDYVQDLLGENFVCWGTHYFYKLGHDSKSVPWHQAPSY